MAFFPHGTDVVHIHSPKGLVGTIQQSIEQSVQFLINAII